MLVVHDARLTWKRRYASSTMLIETMTTKASYTLTRTAVQAVYLETSQGRVRRRERAQRRAVGGRAASGGGGTRPRLARRAAAVPPAPAPGASWMPGLQRPPRLSAGGGLPTGRRKGRRQLPGRRASQTHSCMAAESSAAAADTAAAAGSSRRGRQEATNGRQWPFVLSCRWELQPS